ncbi:MAG: hypothetical protein ACTS27_09150, partial [Phycisphaerales bacterium]
MTTVSLRPAALLVAFVGLSAAHAQPDRAGALTDLRVQRSAEAPPAGAAGAAPRDNQQYPFGTLVSVRDELENFPVDVSLGGTGVNAAPTSFTGPPGFQWPFNNLRGQSSVNFVRLVDLSTQPVGGPNGVVNSSKAVRIFTATAQAAGGFFTGANLRFGGGAPGDTTLPLEPIPGHNARISAEHYLSSIDSLYTFEPIATFTGFITGRLLWGGTCVEVGPGDCTDIGLPIGPILHFHTINPFTSFGIFSPTYYCEDGLGFPIPDCVPHPGFDIGDPVPPPTQNWFRLIAETTADGRLRYSLDLLDGTQEAAFFEAPVLSTMLIDRVGWNASFEAQGEFMLVDNIEASGALFQLPKPPPLLCPYSDDVEWLNTGPVIVQTNRWFAALSSALTVIENKGNRFLRQINSVRPDNQFREEFNTTLPNAYALPGDPWTLCFDAATTLNGSGNATARAFSIDAETNNFIFGGVTARVFLGRTIPITGFADSTIYVQINPEYNPIDDIDSPNPLQQNIPVVGVDIVSTGVQWPADGQFRTLCVTVANDNDMTLSLDGVVIYTGAALSNAAAELSFESENTILGEGARLDIDNVAYDCDPFPVVTLPDLAAPYIDDFAWGVDNVPPQRHIDDPADSPVQSTRYTNAPGVVAFENAVAMRNVFRDTTQIAPPNINQQDAFVFTHFTTRTPSIVVDAQAGWRVEMTLTLSDFLTSRGFAPAQLADVGGVFELNGYLWISAVNQRVYLFAHPENASPDDDLLNIDTGFTLAALGVAPGAPFTAAAEYNRATGMIDWSINSIALGSTLPIIGTDDLGNPRVHRNLDRVFVFGGDDDAAPATQPLSTLSL